MSILTFFFFKLMTSHYSINGLQWDYVYLFSIAAYAYWHVSMSIRKLSFAFPRKHGRMEVSYKKLLSMHI